MASIFADDLHAQRVISLANGVTGVLRAASLSIHAIGRGYAQATQGQRRHGVKQVDRLLSNDGVVVWELFAPWVQFVVGDRTELVIALDWTEFDSDGHATLSAQVLTGHGRATPLLWLTVPKATLQGQRNEHEYRVIERLHACIAPNVRLTVLADRGFGDQKLYCLLETLGWDYVIRFRGNILVEDEHGASKPAAAWLPPTGRATRLRDVRVTADRAAVPAVVVVHDKKMKEPWCLATSRRDDTARAITKLYGRRFTIEESFRDTKNLRFGLGLSATHIGSPARRDRLLLIAAIAQALLTLLGAAGETCGLDRTLKTNTSARTSNVSVQPGSLLVRGDPKYANRLVAATHGRLRGRGFSPRGISGDVMERTDSKHRSPTVRIYLAVWICLIALATASLLSSMAVSGTAGLALSLVIAGLKAALVAAFFMHLAYGRPVHRMASGADPELHGGHAAFFAAWCERVGTGVAAS